MVGCVHGGFTRHVEGEGTDLLVIFPADHRVRLVSSVPEHIVLVSAQYS